MTRPLIVLDVGDVLVRTVPMAHYRAIARWTKLEVGEVTSTIEGSGVVSAFESGAMTADEFAGAVSSLLGGRVLPRLVEHFWDCVLAEMDDVVAVSARRLTTAGTLLLASNTNPFHWAIVRRWLSARGLCIPAVLSFQIGYTKPDPRFFDELCLAAGSAAGEITYVDDRRENVLGAIDRGMIGRLHHGSATTAGLLQTWAR